VGCNTGACDILIEDLEGLDVSGVVNLALTSNAILLSISNLSCPGNCSGVVVADHIGFLVNLSEVQLSTAWGIAGNAEAAYFTDQGTPGYGDGTVMTIPLDGGVEMILGPSTPPTILADDQDVPWAITVDSTSVYWTNRSSPGTSNGTVVKMPLAGGEPDELASRQDSPWGIAVDSTYVYWVNQGSPDGGNGSVMKVGLDGGTPVLIASDQNAPWSIAVDSANVYWTNYGFGANAGSVMAAPLDGGVPVALATGQDSPWGLALDAASLYWANFGSGTIMTANLDGTNQKVIATGITGPQAVAVDAASLYYASYGTGFGILTPK
jgi:hypothetical protein